MCSDRLIFLSAALLLTCCVPLRKLGEIHDGLTAAGISIPEDAEVAEENDRDLLKEVGIDTAAPLHPLVMRAIKDEITGEMVATDVIRASKVTARFRNVAERFGKVYLEFDINVPAGMTDSRWQLRFIPRLWMMGDTTALDPVFITGSRYRESQLRGYQRYEAFLRSIITDSLDFIRTGQLEIFLERHFPETYAMKNDSSVISEPDAANYFGVTQRQALEHYTRHMLRERNERRKASVGKMFRKFVKDPLVSEGIRLDTVITSPSGDIVYRYGQSVQSRQGLRKITVSLDGSVWEDGKCLCGMPDPAELDFYVSSLSTLAEPLERFKTKVVERRVYDRTMALIDFRQGSADIDTTLESNASELRRITDCVKDIASREEFEADSIVVTASCSPEGAWSSNALLSGKRAAALARLLADVEDDGSWKLVSRPEPENWRMLDVLVSNDTSLLEPSRKELLDIIRSPADRDAAEARLAGRPEYRHLREKIYPRLRTVQLEFHLHRRGMVKDTVHTTEPDTAYSAGLEALRALDYRTAVERLRPYRDYNSALALLAASYNHTALDVLEGLPENAGTLYLKAVALSRLSRRDEALEAYRKAVDADPSMAWRANLDPEISDLIKNKHIQ